MKRRFDGQALRALRLAAGMSRELVAVKINRSAQTVFLYEHGDTTPPVGVLVDLADALGVDVNDLLCTPAHAAA